MHKLIFVLLVLTLYRCNSKPEKTNIGNDKVIHFEVDTLYKDGIPLKIVKKGVGETIVVVGSADYYSNAFSKKLNDSFEMFYVDGRQVSVSYAPAENETLDLSTWADDLEYIRQELKLDKFTLVGHSIHAQIAIEYTHKYPSNVKRLVLLCGVPYKFSEFKSLTDEFWKNEADSIRKQVAVVQGQRRDSIMKITSPEDSFAASYDLNRAKYWLDPNYDASELIGKYRISPKTFNQLINSALSKEDVIKKLNHIEPLTLVILGKYDFGVPYLAWGPIIEQTDVEYILMQNASHNPFTEETSQKEFDKVFLDWMSKTN